jgi:hypothetical protein
MGTTSLMEVERADLAFSCPERAETHSRRPILEPPVTHVVSYRLRNAARPTEIYGEDIPDESDAVRRAEELAGFYQEPVEVCQVAMGRISRSVRRVDPGPVAPAPLADRSNEA